MANAVATGGAELPHVATWAPLGEDRVLPARCVPSTAGDRFVTRDEAAGLTRTASLDPRQNHLLAALPAADLERLAAHLEPVAMRQGDPIHRSGQLSRSAYFPTTSVISLQCFTQSGASAEVATVGREGFVCGSLAMSGDAMPGSALVQAAGHAYRLPVHHLRSELNQGGPLARLLLHYAQALITQLTQIAVCNRHHTIEQRVCRWLLAAADRAPSGLLSVTQDLVARALGVRREGVTRAAGGLQQAGLIRYRRGHVVVLDRTGLERRSCECYGVIRTELERPLD